MKRLFMGTLYEAVYWETYAGGGRGYDPSFTQERSQTRIFMVFTWFQKHRGDLRLAFLFWYFSNLPVSATLASSLDSDATRYCSTGKISSSIAIKWASGCSRDSRNLKKYQKRSARRRAPRCFWNQANPMKTRACERSWVKLGSHPPPREPLSVNGFK